MQVFAQPWPGIMRTVYGDHQRYETTYFKKFPGYYCTGDGAKKDKVPFYSVHALNRGFIHYFVRFLDALSGFCLLPIHRLLWKKVLSYKIIIPVIIAFFSTILVSG